MLCTDDDVVGRAELQIDVIRDFRPVSDFAQVLAQVLASGFSLRFQQVPHSEYIFSRKNPNRLRFFLAARHSNGVVLCRSKRDDMERSPSICPVTKPPHTSQRTHGRKKSGALASVSQVALFGFPTRILGFGFCTTRSMFWVTCVLFSRRSDTQQKNRCHTSSKTEGRTPMGGSKKPHGNSLATLTAARWGLLLSRRAPKTRSF